MEKKQHERRFLGKTENFTDKTDRHFYQRMLKAYLKGHEYFYFGFITNPIGLREPVRYKVLQSNV